MSDDMLVQMKIARMMSSQAYREGLEDGMALGELRGLLVACALALLLYRLMAERPMSKGARIATAVLELEAEAQQYGCQLCGDWECPMADEPHWHVPAGKMPCPMCGLRGHRPDCPGGEIVRTANTTVLDILR